MKRSKLLLSNTIYFGGLKLLSSIFPLVLLPYITKNLKGVSDFGLYDIFMVISSFGANIALLGLTDALFREYHKADNKELKRGILASGYTMILITSIVLSVFLFINNKFISVLVNINIQNNIIQLSAIYLMLQNIVSIFTLPIRLENNKKFLLVETLINGIAFYFIAVILLKISSSFYVLIYSQIATAVILILVFAIVNRRFFFPFRFSKHISFALLKIGIPLMPIFIVYWANNSLLRILITKYLGASELGIFAIGSKYASVSSLLQMAFAGGYSYFTFSTMKDIDQIGIKSKIFEVLSFCIVVFYVILTPFAPFLFNLLFTGEFIKGYTVFPQLFLGPLFLILYQIISNQFTIIGKSYYSLIAISVGFLFSFAFNIILLERGFGIITISYSIPISYLISIIIIYLFAKRNRIFDLKIKIIFAVIVIFLSNVIINYFEGFTAFYFLVPLLLFYMIQNRAMLKETFAIISNLMKIKFAKD